MRKLVPRRRGTQQSFLREGVAQRFNPNLVPRSHSVLHLAVGDLGMRLVQPLPFCQKRYLLQLIYYFR